MIRNRGVYRYGMTRLVMLDSRLIVFISKHPGGFRKRKEHARR